MIFWITNDRYSSAEGSYHIAFRNGVLGVIGAFGVNIGLEREEQLFDSRLIENRHKVNSFQCGYDLGSLVLGYERSAIALQSSSLFVRIHADNQKIAQGFRRFEVANMANMKDVEATISQYNSASFSLCGFDDHCQIAPFENSSRSAKGIGFYGHAFDSCAIDDSISSTLTVDVPRFETTIPPARFASRAASANEAPADRASA